MNRYLFLVSLKYAFPIMRPLQKATRARGDEAAWFFDEPDLEVFATEDEKVLHSVEEVMEYDPDAVFTAGNHMYHFFPGVKVELFHGFNIDKRPGRGDHFSLKGWVDLYCTQGPTSTHEFQRLAEKKGYFKVAETGWTKFDAFAHYTEPRNGKPVILYTSTFTKWITSTPYLFEEIERLVAAREWEWLITFHPKTEPEIKNRYAELAARFDNVTFYDGDNNIGLLERADVMLSDSSSIIVEFLYLGKPAVTYKNTSPGTWLVDIDDPALLEESLERTLARPPELMEEIERYIDLMNPCRDGKASERVLAAVDSLIAGEMGPRKRKPINLVRKFQARKKLKYWKCRRNR